MQKTAALRPPASAVLTIQSVTPYVLWTLLIAGLGELLLFRTLSRVGVHIPKQGAVLDVYDALVQIGSFSFNVSSVMVFPALGIVAYAALRRAAGRDPLLATGAAIVAGLAAVSFLLAFVDEGPSARFAYGIVFVSALLAFCAHAWVRRRHEPLRALVVGLIALAYLAAQYYALANHAYRAFELTSAPAATTTTLEVAELLVLANAVAVFCLWSGVRRGLRWRPHWSQVAAAGLLVVLFLGSYGGGEDSSTTAILSLWTLGLTLYLPLPLYALALGLYGAAWVACFRRARLEPGAMKDAIALGLLPVAGLTLETSYQHLLALLALMLLLSGRDSDSSYETSLT